MLDLDSEGLPEAVATEGGSYCDGHSGAGYWVASERAKGGWKVITSSTGMASFLKTRGLGGWPDIEVGGPVPRPNSPFREF